MLALLTLAAISFSPRTEQSIHYDLAEVNHFHDELGLPVFIQLIFWDWCPLDDKYHVQAWHILRNCYKDDPAHRKAYDEWVKQEAQRMGNYRMQSRWYERAEQAYDGRFSPGLAWPRWHRGAYRSLICVGDRWLIVTATRRRETWTQYDPERLDRREWPEDRRRGFFQDD